MLVAVERVGVEEEPLAAKEDVGIEIDVAGNFLCETGAISYVTHVTTN